MNYVGTISKVTERVWGKSKLTSWQLKGQNVWYRTTGESDLLAAGNMIAFGGPTPNKIDFDSIVEDDGSITETRQEAQASTMKALYSGPTMLRDDYWRWKQLHDLEREDAFEYSKARHDATLFLTCALDNDMLDIPKSLAKAKRYALFMALLNEVTVDLFTEAKEYKASE